MINHEQRAFRAWPILVKVAKAHDQFITYGDLARQIGIHPRAVRYVLGAVQEYCLSEGLPPLTIVVVYQNQKIPGRGFVAWEIDDLAEGRRRVEGYDWDSLPNPFSFAESGETDSAIAGELIANPSAAAEIYARVRVRGVAQRIFRKALLQAYGRCAFCGITFEPVLEACHLVPWAECSPDQRMCPSNGLLLCATHHRMFDSGILTLTPSRTICYDENEYMVASESDRSVSSNLEGQAAHLPSNPGIAPSDAFLRGHHDRMGWDFDEEWQTS